jgi:hypothetical protein
VGVETSLQGITRKFGTASNLHPEDYIADSFLRKSTSHHLGNETWLTPLEQFWRVLELGETYIFFETVFNSKRKRSGL